MYNSVLPMGGRPLFIQVDAGYTFTQITADRVAAADGHYDVLFIGTGQCPAVTAHKTLSRLSSTCQRKLPLPSPIFTSLPGLCSHLLLDAGLIVPTHILHLSNHAKGKGLRSEEIPSPSCQETQGITHSSSLQTLAQC